MTVKCTLDGHLQRKNCASSWLFTRTEPRCTVNKTLKPKLYWQSERPYFDCLVLGFAKNFQYLLWTVQKSFFVNYVNPQRSQEGNMKLCSIEKLFIIIFFVRKYQTYDHAYFFIQDICSFCLNNQTLHCMFMSLDFNISLYSWELKAKYKILYYMASCFGSKKSKDFCKLSGQILYVLYGVWKIKSIQSIFRERPSEVSIGTKREYERIFKKLSGQILYVLYGVWKIKSIQSIFRETPSEASIGNKKRIWEDFINYVLQKSSFVTIKMIQVPACWSKLQIVNNRI